jgi:pimeloyl-ACP methyl ester carboxylesterase
VGVTDFSEELDDQPVFWREAPTPDGGRAPVLFLHDVPSSSDEWLPFLRETGGLAPDLPGFGRSGKRGDQAFDLAFYDQWVERFLQARGIDRVRLVVHGWGAVGLQWAQRAPERVERLVLINPVPLLPGHRPRGRARLWASPLAGEVAIGLTGGRALRRAGMPAELAASAATFFDQGTQRAVLRLYRSATPEALAEAGRRLERITSPALVLWGDRDVALASEHADVYGQRLPASEVRHLDAGRWPWMQRPEVVHLAAHFLRGR